MNTNTIKKLLIAHLKADGTANDNTTDELYRVEARGSQLLHSEVSMSPAIKPPVVHVASVFGCTAQQVRRQYAMNAAQLESMAERASLTGRRVNGWTERELRTMAADAQAMSL